MENNNINQKRSIFKRYMSSFIIGGVTLILIITLVAISIALQNNSSTEVAVSTTAVEFIMPVTDATISKDYSDTELQWNETLKQWEAHLAIDFSCEEGTIVMAAMDGEVTEVSNNYLQGYYVVIDHADGLQTVYQSLDSSISVSVGDIVKAGTQIGVVGNTSSSESEDGAHLHFAVLLNGSYVNPNDYFTDNK